MAVADRERELKHVENGHIETRGATTLLDDSTEYSNSSDEDITKCLVQLQVSSDGEEDGALFPLHDAVESGDARRVEDLLQSTALAFNDLNVEGYAPLHIAARGGNVTMLQHLIAKVNLDRQTKRGHTALHLCCKHGHLAAANFLLSAGINHPVSLKNGANSLHLAVMSQHYEVARLLLESRFDPNGATKDGTTPLLIAVRHRALDMVQLLLNFKANPSMVSISSSPIHLAAKDEESTLLRTLFDSPALRDYTSLTDSNGNTPLHLAIEADLPENAAFLMEKGADLYRPNKNNVTPLCLGERKWQRGRRNLLASFIERFHRKAFLADFLSRKEEPEVMFELLLTELMDDALRAASNDPADHMSLYLQELLANVGEENVPLLISADRVRSYPVE